MQGLLSLGLTESRGAGGRSAQARRACLPCPLGSPLRPSAEPSTMDWQEPPRHNQATGDLPMNLTSGRAARDGGPSAGTRSLTGALPHPASRAPHQPFPPFAPQHPPAHPATCTTVSSLNRTIRCAFAYNSPVCPFQSSRLLLLGHTDRLTTFDATAIARGSATLQIAGTGREATTNRRPVVLVCCPRTRSPQ